MPAPGSSVVTVTRQRTLGRFAGTALLLVVMAAGCGDGGASRKGGDPEVTAGGPEQDGSTPSGEDSGRAPPDEADAASSEDASDAPASGPDAANAGFRDDPECFGVDLGGLDPQAVRCGTVTVPLHHEDPGAGTIELAVAVLAGGDADRFDHPTLLLGGGPGMPMVETLLTSLRHRIAYDIGPDLIVLDQRGVGLSTPALDCPELDELGTRAVEDPPTVLVAVATVESGWSPTVWRWMPSIRSRTPGTSTSSVARSTRSAWTSWPSPTARRSRSWLPPNTRKGSARWSSTPRSTPR
jgi:hypothetical protein